MMPTWGILRAWINRPFHRKPTLHWQQRLPAVTEQQYSNIQNIPNPSVSFATQDTYTHKKDASTACTHTHTHTHHVHHIKTFLSVPAAPFYSWVFAGTRAHLVFSRVASLLTDETQTNLIGTVVRLCRPTQHRRQSTAKHTASQLAE